MSFIISFAAVILFSVLLRKPIKQFSILFYILAILISTVGIYFTLEPNPNEFVRVFAFAIQKGHVGLSLFALVMFVGVFDKTSPVRKMFNPIRAELSIMGCILILAHLGPYLSNYLSMAANIFSLRVSILFSFSIALIMLVLLIVLTVTSFNVLKTRMNAAVWKKVQLLAYPFFVLAYLHLMGYLIIPAFGGSMPATINIIVYTVLFVAYTILRVRKALIDRKTDRSILESAHAE
jgi:DMSO/TMAO reductase YedYZ heme-binding membrane subunit